jgi:peptide/nickel transport system substrate-binding protein
MKYVTQQKESAMTRWSFHPAAAIAVVITATSLVACAETPGETGPTELRIAVTSPVQTTVRSVAERGTVSADSVASQGIYETLVVWDESTNTLEPNLAADWTISDDGRTAEFVLREDVDCTDGSHFDAHAAEAYLDWVWSEGHSQRTGLERGVVVTATDDYTLSVTTTDPIHLAQGGLSIHLQGIPCLAMMEDPEADIEPIGTGPYLIADQIPDSEITLVRNPDYRNPEAFPFDSVTLTVYADNVAALNALKSGQIDATAINAPLAAEAEASGFTINRGEGTSFGTLIISDHIGSIQPALGDVRVRQAMNLAFDRASIAESLDSGFGSVSSQPFTEGLASYVEGGDTRYDYDLERARELMADAGFADGFDLVIPSSAGVASYEPIVQQSLADIGIRVEFEQFPDPSAFYTALGSGTYAVTMMESAFVNTVGLMLTEVTGGTWAQPFTGDIHQLMLNTWFQRGDDPAADAQEVGEYLLDEAIYVPFSKPANLWATTEGLRFEIGDIVGFLLLSNFTLD